MTKKVLGVVLSLVLALSLCVCAFAEETAEAVEIATVDDLYAFAERVNAGETALDAILTDNIIVNENVFDENGALISDTSALKMWTPLGKSTVSDRPEYEKNTYIGTFDGNGFYISGLYYNTENGTGGLFESLGETGVVKNLGVINSYFKGDTLGAITGTTEGYAAIENCYSDCFVAGDVYVGGITGTLSDTSVIRNCYSLGSVFSPAYAGGIAGVCWGTVENSYNYGSVVANSDTEYIGGLCGLTMGGSVTNSYFNTSAFSGEAIGAAEYDTVIENAEGKGKDAFKNGEIAFLLQGEQEEPVWGQDIDNGNEKQKTPSFTGGKVYTVTNCKGNTIYTNHENLENIHIYKDGNCIYCYKYEPQGNSSPAVSSIALTVFAFIEALINFLSSFFA